MSFGPAGFGDMRLGTPDDFSLFGTSGYGASFDRRLLGGASSGFGVGSQVDRRVVKSFLGNPIDSFQQQAAADATKQQAQYQQDAASGADSSGQIGNPTGGNWAGVNKWNADIQRASNATGVPANVIKSIMMIESQGVLNARSPMTDSGTYFGLMQIGATSSVPEYMKSEQWLSQSAYNQILAGATELKEKYRAVGATDWSQAAGAYFGYGTDVTGTTTSGYVGQFNSYMNQLQSASQSFGGNSPLPGTSGLFGGGGSSGGGGALQTAFGGRWDGNSDFGVTSDNGLYGYGTAYGLNGVQHTGMDIMQPLGSVLYAPVNAKVVCVGCWRNDHITNGVGRIELELSDGTHVLFDHSNLSYVQVGQTVQAGQAIGTSGGMYSPHTHLEVRVPDGSTSSGYRLVDPARYFAGQAGAANFGGGGTQQSSPYAGKPWYQTPIWQQLAGRR